MSSTPIGSAGGNPVEDQGVGKRKGSGLHKKAPRADKTVTKEQLVRVKDTTPPARVDGVTDSRGASSAASGTTTTPADKVSVEETRDRTAVAAEVRRQVGDIRQERLVEIEAAVRSGNYKPDPRVIAERILQAAALDATLAVNLRKP
jgi:anti-sigma28 factor (negative regulator of flagellin synthesis)